jgi:Sulfate permease family
MSEAEAPVDKRPKGWRLPLFESIQPLNRLALVANLAAGISLAALNIPQAMGYAKIAGMPVITGLYTLLLPVVALLLSDLRAIWWWRLIRLRPLF